MSIEFPTPKADAPTFRIPYEKVPTIKEAVAWIRHPPFPPELLKKLKKGVLLTARMQAEWVRENGQRGEEIAAMGLVLRAGTRNVPAKIAVVTGGGISVDGKRASAKKLGWPDGLLDAVVTWLTPQSTAEALLLACDGVPLQLLTLTACHIARAVLPLVATMDKRPLTAVETAESWAYGRATIDQVKWANEDARDCAAVGSIGPHWAAAWAAGTALSVGDSAARAAHTAASAAAISDVHKINCAQLVREWIGLPDVAFAHITGKTPS